MFVFLPRLKVPEILFGSASGVSGSGAAVGPDETAVQLHMILFFKHENKSPCHFLQLLFIFKQSRGPPTRVRQRTTPPLKSSAS